MIEPTKIVIVLVTFRYPWDKFSVIVISAVYGDRRAFTVRFFADFAARSRYP